MNKNDLKKDMTVNELAVLMMEGFERLENSLRLEMRTGFAEAELKFCKAEKERREIREDLKHLNVQNSTRLEILEDRTVVLKKAIEKGLDVKVVW